ncbi:MAG: hypothetical protein FJW20_26085 [Acidimicrobiia bacterium]|nr:hypothetical protein [Acidimicrobiia bacterium]
MPAVVKLLLAEGLLNGDCKTVTGKTLRENVKDLPGLFPSRKSAVSITATNGAQPEFRRAPPEPLSGTSAPRPGPA